MDASRWISLVMGMVILLLGWLFSYIVHIDGAVEGKADKTDASDRWTGAQQKEYRENVDNQFNHIESEVGRIRDKIRDAK